MKCPLCDSEMREWTTKKKMVYWLCSRYPQCPICCTTKAMDMLAYYMDETKQLENHLSEAQERFMALSDSYKDLAGRDGASDYQPIPLRLGEYVCDVAKVAIVRSQRKQEKSSAEQIRLEADKEQG